MKGVALRQTATGWAFISEAALEHFLWQNLAALGLTPLRQQYRLKEEICDLLAVDQQRGLVLLELKNVEDRSLMLKSRGTLTPYWRKNLLQTQLIMLVPFACWRSRLAFIATTGLIRSTVG